jgi:hypothetical protein
MGRRDEKYTSYHAVLSAAQTQLSYTYYLRGGVLQIGFRSAEGKSDSKNFGIAFYLNSYLGEGATTRTGLITGYTAGLI